MIRLREKGLEYLIRKEYSDTVVKEERKRIYKEVLRGAERQDRRNIFRSTLKWRKEGQKT